MRPAAAGRDLPAAVHSRVAQLVEQPAVNRRVAGSSPASGALPAGTEVPLARYSGKLARRTQTTVDAEPVRLLLVEDNPRHVELLREAFGEAGVAYAGAAPFELAVAGTLAAALDRLKGGAVDVVLLDLTLPDAQGLDPILRIRERYPDVPLIALTALGDDRLPALAVQAGAQDYLMKGKLSGELLARAIRHAVELNRLQAALRSLSFLDGLTGLYNRRGFVTLAEPHLKLAQRVKGKFLVVSADVTGLAAINGAASHDEGDRVLRDVADILKKSFRDSDLLARLEGGAFMVLAADAATDKASVITDRIAQHVSAYNGMTLRPYTLTLGVGYTAFDSGRAAPIEDLMVQAVESRRGRPRKRRSSRRQRATE